MHLMRARQQLFAFLCGTEDRILLVVTALAREFACFVLAIGMEMRPQITVTAVEM
jgi:hypothetical protein